MVQWLPVPVVVLLPPAAGEPLPPPDPAPPVGLQAARLRVRLTEGATGHGSSHDSRRCVCAHQRGLRRPVRPLRVSSSVVLVDPTLFCRLHREVVIDERKKKYSRPLRPREPCRFGRKGMLSFGAGGKAM